jgi:hypothetical protein
MTTFKSFMCGKVIRTPLSKSPNITKGLSREWQCWQAKLVQKHVEVNRRENRDVLEHDLHIDV